MPDPTLNQRREHELFTLRRQQVIVFILYLRKDRNVYRFEKIYPLWSLQPQVPLLNQCHYYRGNHQPIGIIKCSTKMSHLQILLPKFYTTHLNIFIILYVFIPGFVPESHTYVCTCMCMHVCTCTHIQTPKEFCVEVSDLQYIENNRDKIMKPDPINHTRSPSDVAKCKRLSLDEPKNRL